MLCAISFSILRKIVEREVHDKDQVFLEVHV